MRHLLQTALDVVQRGERVALATIVYQQGSAPRGAGSQLVANATGLLAGTTGGGLAEGMTIKACASAVQQGKPCVLEFAMDGTLAAQSEMICGGVVRVLVEVFAPDDALVLAAALRALDTEGCLIVRPYQPQQEGAGCGWTLLFADGHSLGAALPPEVCHTLVKAGCALREASVLEAAGQAYFVDICRPAPRMIIAGGGHVSRPTAQIAALAGFTVHVLDDRAEFAAAERFPWAAATKHIPEFTQCFTSYGVREQDFLVIVTRGHLFDESVLAQALQTPAGYIGMIGSKRKREQIYAHLQEQGVSQAALARVTSPIGLAIKAETPEEIAVSIVAQCIAHKRGA
jgi:xanthine dehydrogenase accessory factor